MKRQFRCEHGEPQQQEEKNQSEMTLRVMNRTFRLGTLGLILMSVTSCNEVKLAVNTDIESPLRNTCQSGDLIQPSRSVRMIVAQRSQAQSRPRLVLRRR